MDLRFEDSKIAFAKAISKGLLSKDRKADNYSGMFMYMYSKNQNDYFKHRQTRKYMHDAHALKLLIKDLNELNS